MQKETFDGYTYILNEMSRRSQIEAITELDARLDELAGKHEVQRAAAITNMVLLRSRLTVLDPRGDRLPDGIYALPNGDRLTLPLTEEVINEDLSASLVGWLIEASAKENKYVLESFLAGLTAMMPTAVETN